MRRLLLFVLFSTSALAGEPVQVQVLSAVVKDQRIEGAEVIVQKNGAQSVEGLTRGDGLVSVSPAFADTDEGVLLIIKKSGYSPLVSQCPCRGMTYALSPVMRSLDGLRVVLTWGRSPADLDLHAVFPGNHVFFSKKTGRTSSEIVALAPRDASLVSGRVLTLMLLWRHGVVLFHDVHPAAREALPRVFEAVEGGAVTWADCRDL